MKKSVKWVKIGLPTNRVLMVMATPQVTPKSMPTDYLHVHKVFLPHCVTLAMNKQLKKVSLFVFTTHRTLNFMNQICSYAEIKIRSQTDSINRSKQSAGYINHKLVSHSDHIYLPNSSLLLSNCGTVHSIGKFFKTLKYYYSFPQT